MQEFEEIYDSFEIKCCERPSIVETGGFYTCKNCGMVLDRDIIHNNLI